MKIVSNSPDDTVRLGSQAVFAISAISAILKRELATVSADGGAWHSDGDNYAVWIDWSGDGKATKVTIGDQLPSDLTYAVYGYCAMNDIPVAN